MSLHSYQRSIEIARNDEPFSAFIMAAARKADSSNFIKLKSAFPEIIAELQERYDSPVGLLKGER